MEKNSVSCKIINKLGLHARASALFVKTASRFRSEVFVSKGKTRVNGKSIMGLLMLAAGQGSKITIEVVGPDDAIAIQKLTQLVENGFNEQ